jgi:ketosteroid isomerase-like protein
VASAKRAVVEELIGLMNSRTRTPSHLCHPELEWYWPDAMPGGSVYRGHEELERGLRTFEESWDELILEPEEFLEDGDYLLAMVRYRARGAGSGVPLETPIAHLHLFEDGLVRRWWMFGDADKARRRFLAGDRPD